MASPEIKTCPGCGARFTLPQILEHQEIEPVGMQFIDPELKENMYYFNHICANCGSTFLISVIEFLPFIKETIPEAVMTGTDVCGGHCTRLKDLEECQAPCMYAPFRRFLLSLKREAATSQPQPAASDAGSAGY